MKALQVIPRELSEGEKDLRHRFVNEYLVDYNYVKAAIRIGYGIEVAEQYADKLKRDPYVQKLLSENDIAEFNSSDITEANKLRVLNSLVREANFTGENCSHAARVSALAKLASILGMDAPEKKDVIHSGSVDYNVNFDFSKLNDDERKLMRKLLNSRIENDGQDSNSQ